MKPNSFVGKSRALLVNLVMSFGHGEQARLFSGVSLIFEIYIYIRLWIKKYSGFTLSQNK